VLAARSAAGTGDNRHVPELGSVRRRQASVLVVGTAEREVHSWLHAAGHVTRAARDATAAHSELAEAPADLIIVDREPRGLDVAGVCRALHEDAQLGEAWMLAITAKGRMADAALNAGADDYLHRPFTRGELLARSRTGLRAVRQHSDDRLMRTLMVNVPGAIYRSAWHAGHTLELISDEIERISGYPPANFIASSRRTLMSIIHPEDQARVKQAVDHVSNHEEPFVLEYRIVRADGEVRWVLDRGQMVPGPGGRLWMDGAIFDITERRAAEEALRRHEIEQARTEELRASRVRIVQAADAARKKIERDLHDGAQQRLVLVSLTLKRAQGLAQGTPAEPTVQEAFDQLRQGLADLRDVARCTVPVELQVSRERAAPDVEAAIYFTVAEALTNVAKYAQATLARVHIEMDDGAIVAEVADDGIGGASTTAGSGLRGLADRLDALDGTLSVDSSAGEGTTIRARVPLGPGV
jgi:PAS domain S-box-containing protein